MLPGVKILFENGQIGTVVSTADGVFGLLASAAAVGTSFLLETPYMVKSMVDVAALGIVNSVDNHRLYKALSEFYQEASEGTELWIMGYAKTKKVSDLFTLVDGKTLAAKLLDAANGKLTGLFSSFSPTAYTLTLEEGIDADVFVAMNLAQIMAENYTAKKYAPFFVVLEGYGYNGTASAVADLTEKQFNRVGVLLGDTTKRTANPPSNGAAIGVLAGRLAKNRVSVNIGKVKDGALSNLNAYILDTPVEMSDIETLHDKGYITFRTHQGRSGYYFTDDALACEPTDDYRNITNRRVIDKAYRRVFNVMTEYILDEVPVTNTGTIDAFYAKNIEGHIERDIKETMIANGELSFDINAPRSGVRAFISLDQNIVQTSRLQVSVKVRPLGYNRDIEINLGFENVNKN